MIPNRSTLLLVTCVTCLSYAHTAHSKSLLAQTSVESQGHLGNTASLVADSTVAQVSSPISDQPVLLPGARGSKVQELQTKLKQLGYYNGEIDRVYGENTRIAVIKFQKAVGLTADGMVNQATWSRLQAAQPQKPKAANKKPQSTQPSGLRRWLWLGIGVLITFAAVGGGLFLVLKMFGSSTSPIDSNAELDDELPEAEHPYPDSVNSDGHKPQPQVPNKGYNPTALTLSELSPAEAELKPTSDTSLINSTSRLSKISIVDELIRDLHQPDPGKRRKAIWDLAQRGDSRAVQPLVELMIDSDSQQRSLILEALSQIGTRTLKPMNRALAISLQDENAEVRKNAIRDLTRIYELMAQSNQLLRHAADDPDAEVQETARWAMSQLNRIRSASAMDNLPGLPNSSNSSDNSSSEPPRSL